MARQGLLLALNGRALRFAGDQTGAAFREGGEGIVQEVTDLVTKQPLRFKCFFEPTTLRRKRSKHLADANLALGLGAGVDALGGAPLKLLENVGPHTPFGILMKNVDGESWQCVKENGDPQLSLTEEIRMSWCYGLAVAVTKLEEKRFIHCDLSPGNVMLTQNGELALVDFDGFVFPDQPGLFSACRGAEGYAAPEVRHSVHAEIGTDRLGLALLCQEFLICDGLWDDLNFRTNSLVSQKHLEEKTGRAHPLLRSRYPQLADLVDKTLTAKKPAERATPDEWREGLRRTTKPAPRQVVADARVVSLDGSQTLILPVIGSLDLQPVFGIRLSLSRNSNGLIYGLVHQGGSVHSRDGAHHSWVERSSGSRFTLEPGTSLSDTSGRHSVILQGRYENKHAS